MTDRLQRLYASHTLRDGFCQGAWELICAAAEIGYNEGHRHGEQDFEDEPTAVFVGGLQHSRGKEPTE